MKKRIYFKVTLIIAFIDIHIEQERKVICKVQQKYPGYEY